MSKWLVLGFTIIFWGLAFAAIKYSMVFLNPFELASLRFLIADVFFLLSLAARRCSLEKRDLPPIFLLGLFGVTIYHVFLNAGEIYVTSGVASLIIATAPIFVLILSWIFLGERITKGKVIGVLIAFGGVAALSKPESGGSPVGMILVFISALSAAGYTVLGKKLMQRYDFFALTSYAMLFGSIPILYFSVPGLGKILAIMDPGLIYSVVFLGVFSTYLGYLGWYYFLEREEASRASVFLLTIPFVALIAGAVMLNESITLLTIAGGIAVIFGILLVLRK
jgi:drug/metabolite transporter (DMT)-like permease